MVRVETSPQLFARIGGALYLLIIGLGIYLQVVLGRVIVSNDAAATAANLLRMESMWRVGITCELLALACVIALAMIYFVLLRPVSRELNLLATFLRMVGIAVEAFATLSLITALFPLGSAAYLRAFTPEQLQALSYLALRSHDYGYGLALLFFGLCFVVHGYLIFRSRYLPRVLGILIQIGGVAYATNSLALFLAPAFAARIFPLILLPAFVAEVSLSVWLLVKGVDVERWRLAVGGATANR